MAPANPHLMTGSSADQHPGTDLAPGTPVVVRCKFDGHWSHEFEVARRDRDGYRVRGVADQRELPAVFPFDDVRPIA